MRMGSSVLAGWFASACTLSREVRRCSFRRQARAHHEGPDLGRHGSDHGAHEARRGKFKLPSQPVLTDRACAFTFGPTHVVSYSGQLKVLPGTMSECILWISPPRPRLDQNPKDHQMRDNYKRRVKRIDVKKRGKIEARNVHPQEAAQSV